MARPLEIKRIDLLVDPFYVVPSLGNKTVPEYSEAEGKKLLEIWKKHVDETAKDPNRLLLLVVTPSRTKWQDKLFDQLKTYIGDRLGKRQGYFRELHKKTPILDHHFQKFKTFEAFAKKNGFEVNPGKVKTRALGEYTNSCVTDYLIGLNRFIGLKNVIPYRNRQSTIIPRKSIAGFLGPWEIPELMKTSEGRAKLRKWAKEYIKTRRKKANIAAIIERDLGKMKFEGETLFKPRPHLMKKKRKA